MPSTTTKSSPWGHPVCATCGGFLPDSCVCPPPTTVKVRASVQRPDGTHTFVIYQGPSDFTDVLDYHSAWRYLIGLGYRNCPAILARAINDPSGLATV